MDTDTSVDRDDEDEGGDSVLKRLDDQRTIGSTIPIIALYPHPGSKPRLIAQDPSALGCAALALGPNDNPWAAAFAAKDNPIFSPCRRALDDTNCTALITH